MAHLYRVRDAQDALLYIGVTENLGGRFLGGHQHAPVGLRQQPFTMSPSGK